MVLFHTHLTRFTHRLQAVDDLADPNYKPPKIPKPAAARARIYDGIAKNELLSQ